MRKFILLFFAIPCYSFGVTITNFNFQSSTYLQYEKAQAVFVLNQTYTNAYNPDEISVDALITLPGGTVVTVPCFYFIPATIVGNSATQDSAQATWMLRYTPTLTGTYAVTIKATDGSGTFYSSIVSFNVTAGNNKGFVRINSANKQFMQFDTGTPYYPVGMNVCWNNGTLVDFYKKYTDSLSDNKSSWMRYWLTDFATQALEWSSSHWSGWYSGLGIYSQRSSGLLDSVLAMCNQKDIYMQLVLQHHGQFSTFTNSEWSGNPYNTSNGGPLFTAGSFFNNASAKAQTKKLYRYIIARWGYSTNVLSWELFNEVEYTDGSNADIDAWHDEMSQYLKSLDVNKHMVTTSSGKDNSSLPLLTDNIAMDQLQFHQYSADMENSIHTTAQTLLGSLTKPIMCGEFGTSGDYTNHPDNWGDHVRKSQWVGMFSEVPSMFWFWDTYIDYKNLYHVFKPLGDFLNGIDIVNETGGNAEIYNFPSISTSVNAVPLMSWGISLQSDFTVTADGSIAGLNNKSSFLHGLYNAYMGNYASFTVNYQVPGTAFIDVNSVSTADPNETVQIQIDGVTAGTQTFTGAGTFSVNVPAGSHVIRYTVTTNDWVEVARYGFTNVAVSALIGYGYHGNTKGYGYITDKSYGPWADTANVNTVSGAVLNVGPLQSGNYTVDYMDPKSGLTTSGGIVSTVSGMLNIPLPNFKKDIAFKVSSNSPLTILTNHFNEEVVVYPNPATTEFYIKGNGTFPYRIELYDIAGKKILNDNISNDKQKINSAGIAKGMYFYKIISKNNEESRGKIMIL